MTVTLNLPPQVEQAYLEEWVAEFKARVHSHAKRESSAAIGRSHKPGFYLSRARLVVARFG